MAAIAMGVIVVFVLGALYVIRQSSGRSARPVGAFRRSRTDTATPFLLSDAAYGSSDRHDDSAGRGSDATDDAGADSSDAGGDSGGGDGGGGGDGAGGSE